MLDQITSAIALRRAQQFEQARQILEGLRDAHPREGRVHYELAYLCDAQGLEREAIPHYEQALELGLVGAEQKGALLGLGSSYRCVGAYQQAAEVLRKGMEQFPDAGEFPAFLAMALYNLGQHSEAMALLLSLLTRTSTDDGVLRYRRAIEFYQDKLDRVW